MPPLHSPSRRRHHSRSRSRKRIQQENPDIDPDYLSAKDKFALILHTLRHRKTMIDKLKKTELWTTVIGAALLALLTQLGLDPDLAAKLIAGLVGTYTASRGFAKMGND